jgi:hypothetical protein
MATDLSPRAGRKDPRCVLHNSVPLPQVPADAVQRARAQEKAEAVAAEALARLREQHGPDWTPPRPKTAKCPHCAAADAVARLNGDPA